MWNELPQFKSDEQRLLAWLLNRLRKIIAEQGGLQIQKPTESVFNRTAFDLVITGNCSIEEAAAILKLTVRELKLKLRNEIKQLGANKNK